MTSTNFLPSTHGLKFPNYWPPGTPDLLAHTAIGTLRVGNANAGLCGGMCFAARDLFDAGLQPPPDTASPPPGSPLLNYLTRRLLASWNIPTGVLTYYSWANTPDHDTLGGLRHGLARMTIQDQIPQLTASIDQGTPCPLGLVTVYSADPAQLSRCHQVLAYAYDRQGTYFRAAVYDPNSPERDDIHIGLDTANPGHTTMINHNVNIAEPIRGFFSTTYSFSDPAAIAGISLAETV
jgi:hypothetical protein